MSNVYRIQSVVVSLALCGSVACTVAGSLGGSEAGEQLDSSDAPASAVELTVSVAQTDFGKVFVGDTVAPLTVSFSNTHKSKAATVTAISIASPFRVHENPVRVEIGPGEQLMVHVVFDPIASGLVAAPLRVTVAHGRDRVVVFSGTGIESTPVGPGAAMVEVPLSAASDDAEEPGTGGPTYLNSSDLELIRDDAGPGEQMVGLRFAVPAYPDATITRAWIQFQTDEVSSEATSLTIFAEATGDAAPFTAAASDLSARPLTSASVTWRPAAWNVVGQAGPDQRSPDLAPLLVEVMHREDWDAGHHVAFIMVGSGSRIAESYEGDPQGAARLHLESQSEFVAECGNGIVEGEETCDGGDCCDATCEFLAQSTTCRPTTGECDSAETCSGDSAWCPTDEHLLDGTTCSAGTCGSGLCRAPEGDCALPETPITGQIHYVNASSGADGNSGSMDSPWRTVSRVNDAIRNELEPGDAVVFRRGQSFTDDELDIRAHGTPTQPLVFGAYGSGERPRLAGPARAASIIASDHIVVRDLELEGSTSSGCIIIDTTSYVTLVNNYVHGCQNNGIVVSDGVDHTALIANYITDTGGNDAISLHDNSQGVSPGSQHWILNNIITSPGPLSEDAIDINAPGQGIMDVKVIGNIILNARAKAYTQEGVANAWLMGNIVANSGDAGWIKADDSKTIWENSGATYIAGNVFFDNDGNFEISSKNIVFTRNTLIDDGDRTLNFRNYKSFSSLNAEVTENIIMRTSSTGRFVRAVSAALHPAVSLNGPAIDTMDRNWFVGTGEYHLDGAGMSFSGWQAAGYDVNSSTGAIPGFSIPDRSNLPWNPEAIWAAITPDRNWAGCDEGIGAVACDGVRWPVALPPLADIGTGWAGPREVVTCAYPDAP